MIQLSISKILTYTLLCIIYLSRFGSDFYFFDLFSHLYLQIFICACILGIWNIYRKYRTPSIVSILCCLFLGNYLLGIDFYGFYAKKVEHPDLIFMNTSFANPDIEVIADYASQLSPKSIAMVELNQELFEHIRNQGKYKYSYYYPDGIFSFGFFSQEDVLEQHTYMHGRYPIGYFRTKARTYLVIHSIPPVNQTRHVFQKEFFQDVSDRIGKEKNFILVGDFNSTPFSPIFQSFFGKYFYKVMYSWETKTLYSLPIDNAISKTEFDASAGIKLSSDHTPILIRFK